MTAGYSCPPAVPSPPELWSALPPEQRHKLPANTRQPRINYSLQLTRHQDDEDHHRPPARRQTPLTSFFSSARTLSLLSFSFISSASCCRRSSITAMFRASFSDSIPFSSSSCRLCKSSSEICRQGDEVSYLIVRRHFCKDQVLFFFREMSRQAQDAFSYYYNLVIWRHHQVRTLTCPILWFLNNLKTFSFAFFVCLVLSKVSSPTV